MMYLRHLAMQNIGPIENFELTPEFAADGRPLPVVLVGRNGAGKTIALSQCVDALTELAKHHFRDTVPRGSTAEVPYYRIISSSDSRDASRGHISLAEFGNGRELCRYVERSGLAAAANLSQELQVRYAEVIGLQAEMQLFKGVVGRLDLIKSMFEDGVVCAFPSSRHEPAHWFNREAVSPQEANTKIHVFGELGKPLVVERTLGRIEEWLLSVLNDARVDWQIARVDPKGQHDIWPRMPSINQLAALTLARVTIEEILRLVLDDPRATLTLSHRVRGRQRLSVARGDGTSLPTLHHMSTGQSILFAMFATLLRYADLSSPGKSISPATITGIVLIDEVDAHLHGDLQHKTLPELMRYFPGVQFVISSHSPLLLLGLTARYGDSGVQIVELPSGRKIEAEEFSEVSTALARLLDSERLRRETVERLSIGSKPLVMVEGPTDERYIRTGLELLGHSELLNRVEILGGDGRAGDGSGKLEQIWKVLNRHPPVSDRRVVLLFDCDQPKTLRTAGKVQRVTLERNEANKRIRGGIENLLAPDVPWDDFFVTQVVSENNDGGETTKKSLRKMDLCTHVCEVRRRAEDFRFFESQLVPLIRGLVEPPLG